MGVISYDDYFKKKKKKNEEEDILPIRNNNGVVDIVDLVELNNIDIKELDAAVKEYTKEEEKRTWFDTGAFKDGYQIGDGLKTVGGTALNVGANLLRGSAKAGEGIAKLLVGGVAQVSDWVGNDDLADDLRNKLAGKNEELNKFQEKYYLSSNFNKMSDSLDGVSITGEKTDDLISSVGQLLSSAATGSVGANAIMFGSSAGHELENAYKNGATNGEAWGSALISGASEVLFEKLSGGIKFGGSTLDDIIPINVLTDKIANKTAQTLVKLGIDAVGEGFEEVLTEVASNVGRKLTYEDEKTWKEILASDEALDSYLEAFIGGGVMGGGFNTKRAINSIKTGRNYDTGLTTNEQLVLDKEIETRKAEAEKQGKKLSNKELKNIETEARNSLERGDISTDTIESVLDSETYNKYKNQTEEVKSIEKQIKDLQSKKMSELSVGEYNDATSQIRKLQDKLKGIDTNTLKSELDTKISSLIGSDGLLQRSYQEKAQRSVKFEADLTKYDAKQQEVIKKAIDSEILNNTRKTHEFVDMVAKISADKGVSFDFANNKKLKASGFAIEGKQVNGFVNENGITLNIDSNTALNSVVGHEITHVLEGTELYSELQQAVKEYATTKGVYDSKLKELTELYKGVKDANVENELTSDLVGEYLFSDTDFVNNLSAKSPNLFQKIYNEIKYLLKVATAGSKEARQLEKVKKTFEDAYRQKSSNTNKNTEYSFMSEKGSKNAVKNNPNNQILVDKLSEAKELKKEGLTNEEIRQQTLWFQDPNGKWLFEISDSDAELIPLERNKTYKLDEVLIHEDLYEAYPELRKMKVKTKEIKEGKNGDVYSGYYDTFTKTIVINNKITTPKYSEYVRNTILHEIQHRIQTIEGLEKGDNGKNLIKYFSSLGEIEATDVEKRSRMSYEQIKEVAPEVSKEFPIHQTLKDIHANPNSKKSQRLLNDPEIAELYNELYNNGNEGEYNRAEINKKGTTKDSRPNTKKKILHNGRRWEAFIRNNKSIKTQEDLDNRSFFNTDNQGRELSKEQQEYFKDSKVRDENGNLLTVYHGTRADFNVFESERAGQNYENGWSQSGKGFYFTDNKTEAQEFGDYSLGKADTNIKEVYLNITNPFDTSTEDYSVLSKIGKEYGVDQQFLQRGDFLLRWFRNNNINASEVLKKNGYDGIVDYGHYVAFDSNQIKNADNTKPTASKDIRYSLSARTPLENRVSGDDLLDAQDLIDEIKSVGANVDEYGYVTVYHQTSDENAQKIKETGKMISKELDIFFSTSKDAQQSEGKGQTKLEFKIPAEKLVLDDIFGDNADVKIPLNGGKSIDVSEYLVKNNETKYSLSTEDLKQKQLDIVLENNPAEDDYHTWIRNVEDIKTFEETIQDDDWADYVEEGFNPDFTGEMIKEALDTGKITVYSSYPIDLGVFVSPSKMEAESYSGTGKVYSKEVNLTDVAWVDPTQGQYAPVTDENYSISNQNDIAPVKNNNLTYGEDVKLDSIDLPIKEQVANLSNQVSEISNKLDKIVMGEATTQNEVEQIASESLQTNDIAPVEIVNETEYLPDTITMDKKSLKALTDNMKSVLGLNNKQVKTLGEIVQKYSNNESVTRDELYNELETNFGTIYVEERNEYVADVKRELRSMKIKVSESVKEDIADYYKFQQSNFGKIRFSKDGADVDTVYQELSEMYPDFFPRDIDVPSDQLLKMSEVANLDINEVSEFALPEEEIEMATDFIYGSIQDYKAEELLKATYEASNIPIDESMIPVETVDNSVNNISNLEDIVPINDIPKDPTKESSYDNEPDSELVKKKRRELNKLGEKSEYVSNKAFELYQEIRDLRKGIRASNDLSYILDSGYDWKEIKTALLNVKARPELETKSQTAAETFIRENLSKEYDKKHKDIMNMKEDLVTKTKRELRKELLIDDNDFFINALDNAKNKSMALMNNTDTIRNNEIVFGRENGRKINELIFQKEIDNEADSIAWQNKERQEIKDLGIKPRSKESAAVQKYGEKQWITEKGELKEYGEAELKAEFKDAETRQRIKKAAQVIREKYDNYIDTANEVLTRLGFDAIPKRKDYMRHFQELNDIFSRNGIPFNSQSMQEHVLPTDINGLTEFWSPQKNYFANTQHRTGMRTTYDAITGIDGYIGGVANLIYHTEDIQRGRAFEEFIRDTYGEDKGWDNLENLPDEARLERAAKIQDNHLSNYAAWVHEWTNNVAGKKNKLDRSVEATLGRKAFTVLDTVRKQVGANMIGLNLSSSLTNLIAPVQAIAKTNKLAVLKGTADTIKNIFVKDSFMQDNKFLTSRMGSDMISKNAWQKVQDAGFVFMKGLDWFSSNQIVRSKYYELRSKGVPEAQAHAEAGQFAARIMGDRTKGANAQLYNSKLIGLVTQFQLEVNNQLYSMFYDTYHESKENARNNAMRTAAGITFTLGQLFGLTHLFGKTFEAIAGYNPTFDLIGMLATAFGLGDDEEEKPVSERLKSAADQLVDALPYVNVLTGGGRIPVASGIPNLVGVATGGKDEYGNELTLEDELKKLLFLIPPTGGNQFKKTTQGLGMFDEDLPVAGSYTDSGNLRYPVEDTFANRLQAALFGQYANENASNYFDNERQSLKSNQIQEYAELDMPIADYWKYREGLTEAGKTTDENEYSKYLDNEGNVYWYDKENKTVYDANYNEVETSILDLEQASKSEQVFDYISNLDVTDEQKQIMFKNTSSSATTDKYGYAKYVDSNNKTYWYDDKTNTLYDSKYKPVDNSLLNNLTEYNGKDFSNYNNFGSYEEFDYASHYPDKYKVITQIDSFENYNIYKSEIDNIKDYYSSDDNLTSKQKTALSKQRKSAVQQYIESLNLDVPQKIMLEKMAGGYSVKNYKNYMVSYIESLPITAEEKQSIHDQLFD